MAERLTGRGTHQGEFQRIAGIVPTGTSVAVPGVVFYRIADGRITEFRGQFDRMSLLRQLEAIAGVHAPALSRQQLAVKLANEGLPEIFSTRWGVL